MAPRLTTLLDRLETHHGKPAKPVPRGALEWVLWENAGYLVDDARRREAYEALRALTGFDAARLKAAPRAKLFGVARLGGMMPGGRVEKWRRIAEIAVQRYDGDVEAVLELPLEKARRELKRFPSIGAPGADKILLFTGAQAVPSLESNGLRVLTRLGLAEEGKSYAETYRSGMAVLWPHAERGAAWLARAYDLLRLHGQTLCKNRKPLCDDCQLAKSCPSAV